MKSSTIQDDFLAARIEGANIAIAAAAGLVERVIGSAKTGPESWSRAELIDLLEAVRDGIRGCTVPPTDTPKN